MGKSTGLKLKIAFVYTSKGGILTMLKKNGLIELFDEDDEPPPDLLAECDSDETIQAIKNVIQERYTVLPVESDEYAFDVLRDSKPDLVFNIAERLTGPNRESHIPTLCEMLHIPYTGSDPLTLGICLVKSRAKEILSYHGIANPEFHAVDNTEGIPPDIELPAIIKPLYEGSSKGIRDNSVVRTREELKERVNEITAIYQQPVIIEQFLNGREFTVGVLGNYPNIEVLPIVEIDHSSLPDNANPIYSYEAKWIWDTTDKPLRIFTCPAKLSNKLRDQIEKLVVRTCRILNIKDWARIDVRLDDKGTPNIIEVNPLPGILPREEENSCLPKAARTAGYSYSQLIHRVIDETFLRYGG